MKYYIWRETMNRPKIQDKGIKRDSFVKVSSTKENAWVLIKDKHLITPLWDCYEVRIPVDARREGEYKRGRDAVRVYADIPADRLEYIGTVKIPKPSNKAIESSTKMLDALESLAEDARNGVRRQTYIPFPDPDADFDVDDRDDYVRYAFARVDD